MKEETKTFNLDVRVISDGEPIQWGYYEIEKIPETPTPKFIQVVTYTNEEMKHIKGLTAVAYHEAGHAAVHLKLEIPFNKVTIVPDGDTSGCVSYNVSKRSYKKLIDDGTLSPRDEIYFKKEMIIYMAGGVAEAKYLKTKHFSPGSGSDHKECVDIVLRVLQCNGQTASAYLNYIIEEAKAWLDNPELWGYVEKLAGELLERKTLSYKECKKLYFDYYQALLEKHMAS